MNANSILTVFVRLVFVLMLMMLSQVIVFANTFEDIKRMASKEVRTFSSKDLPVQCIVSFEISYPNTWTAQKGVRPAIVQKFLSPKEEGLSVAVGVEKAPAGFDLSQIPKSERYLSYEDARESIPKSAELVQVERTTLDGEPCTMIEYIDERSVAGINISTRNIYFSIINENFVMHITGMMVLKGAGVSVHSLSEWNESKLLLQSMVSTIVFLDKWK